MYSFLLLTTACFTGAVEPQTAGSNYGNPATVQAGTVTYYEPAPAPVDLRTRIRNFLGIRSPSNAYPTTRVVQPVPATAPSFQTAPPPMAQTAPPAETTAVTAQRPDFTLPETIRDKVGHETDYSWITGQLFYVRADGGRWVLRYGQADEVDKYGGGVVLAPTVEMRNFREGDLVCVFGQVVEEGRTSPSLGGPLYRVNSINMVNRSDP